MPPPNSASHGTPTLSPTTPTPATALAPEPSSRSDSPAPVPAAPDDGADAILPLYSSSFLITPRSNPLPQRSSPPRHSSSQYPSNAMSLRMEFDEMQREITGQTEEENETMWEEAQNEARAEAMLREDVNVEDYLGSHGTWRFHLPDSDSDGDRDDRQDMTSQRNRQPDDFTHPERRPQIPLLRHSLDVVRRAREDLENRNNNMSNYESPRSNPRSLYGWAPGSEEITVTTGGEVSEDFNDVLDRANASVGEERGPARLRESSDRLLPRPSTDDHAEGSSRMRTPPLLAMEALLQSTRRQSRLSRARRLENYLLDGQPNRSHENSDDTERAAPSSSSSSRAYRYRPATRGFTSTNLRTQPTARQTRVIGDQNYSVKEIINYLGVLRFYSYEESIITTGTRSVFEDVLHWEDPDLVTNINSIAPPATCSWLQPGIVFTGHQRAANTGSSVLPNRVAGARGTNNSDPIIVGGFQEPNPISVTTTAGRRYMANNRDENWPVKLTIHEINYSDMTLSGTMEAYNIPDKSSPTHDAHIVTFLEGEIIDFHKHTLETENFKADIDVDSTYWRKLPPFNKDTEPEIAKNLVSRKWHTEKMAEGWILMRWKERCFITPTDSRQGLTISGFYYISLQRSSGQIDGLYYDPGSSPYQQLSLKPESERMVRPTYTFR
ncbi:hypothetical protein N7532_010592 [Penicillium argentinense]|uniref:Vacuolar import and degradation protein-domain-containing protein n=1 Tax=Penicillium argentinense TaxID=1131581 RepID=A0A9W9EQ00_9EURO|nr:uncharacterized protein N7532_010592 [Penicillium argentinense]KAJ5085821.1 hypothetical protein N7532_010592 [Penicillium argentinense]